MPEFIAMPRYSGKTYHAIRRALQIGGTIAVTRESTRQRILEVAALTGVTPPEIIVVKKGCQTGSPKPTLIILDYYETEVHT